MNQQFLTELKAVTAENRIFTDEPMKKHTTFRVGGPADILVQPKGTELAAVIRLCRKYDVPYQVIGNGSNLLVGDRGIRGLVNIPACSFISLALESAASVSASLPRSLASSARLSSADTL